MLTLHHQPDRAETYREMHPFRFDKSLNSLVVFDKDLISAIFRSDKFRIVAFADHYRTIAERTGLDYQASIDALDHIPFSKEGDEHKRLRTEMASVVSANSRVNIDLMEGFARNLVEDLFRGGNEVELVQQLARPIFHQLFTLWLHVDHREFLKDTNVSQVFDGAMSLNRRKKVNGNLHALRCAFAEREDKIPTTPDIAVAMNVLGNDALMGSAVLSIWTILERSPGRRLSEIDYPQTLPSTGVPFIERIANEDMEFHGMRVARDQKVRLMLDATTLHVSGEEADLLFGKGRHLCVGKPMTLIIWRALTKAIKSVPLRYTLGEMRLRSGDYAFSYPEYARVSIHD